MSTENIVELAHYRPRADGLLWWTGPMRCSACGHDEVTVVPIPAWAAGPPSCECSVCHGMTLLEALPDGGDRA